MAFIVGRRDGRFEIRESVHTSMGPRSRSLANFAVLTTAVLHTAAIRATRPFDLEGVLGSAARHGVPIADVDRTIAAALAQTPDAAERGGDHTGQLDPSRQRFVQASRRFAATVASESGHAQQVDPGTSLAELIEFAEEVARHQPAHAPEALEFPVLARLRTARQ